MARIRSPNYPAMSLPEAIERIRMVHDQEQHLAAPRDVMARHMGFGGINGSSLKALSALLKYGLLERTEGNNRRVSDLALRILHPREPQERGEAIRTAAFHPLVFAQISQEWPEGTPSDENLRAYLIRRNFARDAIPEVISAYRETMQLVTSESGPYTPPGSSEPVRERVPMSSIAPTAASHRPAPPQVTSYTPLSGEPFRVSFVPGGIEVSGKITSRERADELVAAIEALKLLLQPSEAMNRPTAGDDDDEAA